MDHIYWFRNCGRHVVNVNPCMFKQSWRKEEKTYKYTQVWNFWLWIWFRDNPGTHAVPHPVLCSVKTKAAPALSPLSLVSPLHFFTAFLPLHLCETNNTHKGVQALLDLSKPHWSFPHRLCVRLHVCENREEDFLPTGCPLPILFGPFMSVTLQTHILAPWVCSEPSGHFRPSSCPHH